MRLSKLVILILCLLQVIYVSATDKIEVRKGILDLRGVNLDSIEEVKFNGEWEFYWGQLLESSDFKNFIPDTQRFIQIPSVWTNYKINGVNLPAKGAATYRMQIIVDSITGPIALKLGSVGTAFRLLIDGKEVSKAGKVSLNENDAEPGYNPGIINFEPKTDTVELIFQVSNYHYAKGGIWDSFSKIGSKKHILNSWNRDIQLSILIIGCILIFAIYHLGLFLLNQKFKYTLYFSFFCIIIVFRTIVVNEIYLLDLFPNFNWNAIIKIEYFTLLLGAISFSLFMYKFFSEEYSVWVIRIIVAFSSVFSIIILVTPPLFFTRFLFLYQINIIVASSYIVYVVAQALLRKKPSAFILLIGFLVLLVSMINDILYTNRVIDTVLITSFGFIVFIFSQSYMLSARFSSLLVNTESMAMSLEITNRNLENIVEERTSKIKEQNELLRDQSQEIQVKNDELERQNIKIRAQRDNFETQNAIVTEQKKLITSSIEYARKIQTAVIDSSNEINRITPNNFILFKPKDIVSGDFYWCKEFELEGKILKIISVVDCTGHGVPGAFMSMLGAIFLNKVVGDINAATKASDILNKLRNEVKTLLKQYSDSISVKDGMDMALAIIDIEKMEMQFAGANNPLYIIRNINGVPDTKIEEYKGDPMPIGIYIKERAEFTNHIIAISKNDLIYLFSDGYYDQFGGAKGTKLMKNNFKNILINNAHLDLAKQKEILEKELVNWQGKFEQIDDITVIGIKV